MNNTIFTFNKESVNSGIRGIGGVLPCWWYFPDSTTGGYSEEEIRVQVEQFKNMDIQIVRALSFQPGYAWDEEKGRYDWDSVYMKAFYRYADLMKENGIEIVINPNRSLARDGLLKQVPSCTPFENALKEAKESGGYNQYNRLYGEWIVELIREVIIKRGYTNVKYLEYNTEPNYIAYSCYGYDFEGEGFTWFGKKNWPKVQRLAFEEYRDRIRAADKAMREAGLKDYLKVVGPSNSQDPVGNPYIFGFKWLDWAVEELDDCIDIYAAHFYYRLEDLDKDEYEYLVKREQDLKARIQETRKEIWVDEYNAGAGEKVFERDGIKGTLFSLMTLALYEGGTTMPMLWYLFDTKWPGNDQDTHFDGSWDKGIHKGGFAPVSYRSSIPYKGYYAYCLLSSAIRAGDTIYAGTADGEGIHSVLFEHNDGTCSVVAINMSSLDLNVTYKLPTCLDNVTFETLVYDPYSIVPSAEYKRIESSKTINVTGDSFESSIGPYQVIAYNMIKI